MKSDTIAAIATPMGESGIAIIRLSGENAVAIADGIFDSKQRLSEAASHTINYGYIKEPSSGERIEECLLAVMRAPRSFTMEDVVEIHCHGGMIPVKKVLELVLQQGARLADPGEFTKRAFLNGRIDLAQAEAVIDLIRSKSDRAHSIAAKQAAGNLSAKIHALRQQLIVLMAHIEVNIDYPEHDVESVTNAFIREQCSLVMDELQLLLHAARQGKVLREGIETAIIGRPNVGKSSLLNRLAMDNKAIVTDIPGTTRDVIEEYVTLGGIPLKLLDTAGIRETTDVVERMGVEKSKNVLSQADLILLLLNNNEPLHQDEHRLLEQIKSRKAIVIINKMDLQRNLDPAVLEAYFPKEHIVEMSLVNDEGLQQLEQAITSFFFSGQLDAGDVTYVSNIRHIHLLNQALQSLEDGLEAAENAIPIDMIQIDIRNAWEYLGEIIGDAVSESLIDQIFSQFCLGK